MSYIAFTSPQREVLVSGRERAALSILCGSWLLMQMNISPYSEASEFYRRAIGAEPREGIFAMLDMQTHCNVGNHFWLDGRKIEIFSLQLNSVLSDGNQAAQLAAKLHGQCEIHAYVEGKDRAWLAEIVDEALEAGIFRPYQSRGLGDKGGSGWEAVAELLREDDTDPVVTSYSVTDPFPGPHLAPDDWTHDPEDPWEAWSEMDADQAWSMAMSSLRSEKGLCLSPTTLANRFGHGMNGREYAAAIRDRIASDRLSAEERGEG